MAEPADHPKPLDLGKVFDPKKFNLKLESAGTPEEILSRLKIAESEVEHKLRTEEAG